jgi:hypothetical protein
MDPAVVRTAIDTLRSSGRRIGAALPVDLYGAPADYNALLPILEEHDIPRAKQICPNVIGRVVWPLDEVEAHWDLLTLRSHQVADGREVLYQEGALGRLMPPAALMAFVRSRSGAPLEGSVIFSGTLAALTGGFIYGSRFTAEIADPRRDRRLTLSYDVRTLDPLS